MNGWLDIHCLWSDVTECFKRVNFVVDDYTVCEANPPINKVPGPVLSCSSSEKCFHTKNLMDKIFYWMKIKQITAFQHLFLLVFSTAT